MEQVPRSNSIKKDASLASKWNHQRRITVLARLICMSNDIEAAGAGGGYGVARSMHIEQLSKQDSWAIADQIQVELRRNLRRINRFGPVLRHLTKGSFSGLCWSDSGGKGNAPVVALSS